MIEYAKVPYDKDAGLVKRQTVLFRIVSCFVPFGKITSVPACTRARTGASATAASSSADPWRWHKGTQRQCSKRGENTEL